MRIYFDEDGRVLEVAAGEVERPEDFIEVRDEEAPADLLAHFALGKYQVRGGKLSASESFEEPEPLRLSGLFPEDVAAVLAEKPKKPGKAKRKRKARGG